MRISQKIIIATHNRDKYEEFRALFSAYPEFEPIPAGEIIRNPEKLKYVENHSTYLENAISKARFANLASHYPVIADDSGLEVEALEGRLGVRSHRYAPPQPGVSQTDANIALLLKELAHKPRNARFVCTLAMVIEGILLHATGTLDGTIAEAPRGKNGFGYDSVFIPRGSTKTFAEMSEGEKNSISHRAKALHDLIAQVKSHGIVVSRP